jgi:hypothetical protein
VATLNLLEYSQGFKSCASRQPSEQGRCYLSPSAVPKAVKAGQHADSPIL